MKHRRRIIRIILGLLLSPIVLVVTVAALLYVPPIQRWAVRQATGLVERQTGLDIDIDGVYISFPLDIDLQGLTVTQNGQQVARLESALVDLDFSRILSGEIGVDAIELRGADVNTRQLMEAMRVEGRFDSFHLTADCIDLSAQHVNLNGATMNGCDLDIFLFPTEEEDTTTSEPSPWTFSLEDITMRQSRLALHTQGDSTVLCGAVNELRLQGGDVNLTEGRYAAALLDLDADSLCIDHPYKALQLNGFDANHITLYNLDMGARDLFYADASAQLGVQLTRGRFRERSGLQVDSLMATLRMKGDEVQLDTLRFFTSESAFDAALHIHLAALQPGSAEQLNVRLNGRIGAADVTTFGAAFLPEGLGGYYPSRSLDLHLQARGNVDHLQVQQASMTMPEAIDLHAHGLATQLSNSEHTTADLQLDVQTYDLDWLRRWMQLTDVRLPVMNLTAKVRLTDGHRLQTDALLREQAGRVHLAAGADLAGASYKANMQIANLQLHDFFPHDSLYQLTANATLEGRGLDVMSPRTRLTAQANVDQLGYGQLSLDAMAASLNLNRGKALLELTSDNDLLGFGACAEARIDDGIDDATFSVDLNRIDLHALGFADRPLSASMVMNIDARSDLAQNHHIAGSIRALELEMPDTVYHPLDLNLEASASEHHATLTANAGDLDLRLHSAQSLDSLLLRTGNFLATLQRQASVHNAKKDTMQTLLPTLSLDLRCGDRNPIGNMLRYLTGCTIHQLEANISCSPAQGFSGHGMLQSLRTGSILIDTIRWKAIPETDALRFDLAVNNNRRNRTAVFASNLHGRFTDDGVEATIDIADVNGKNVVDFGAQLAKADSSLRFRFTTLHPTIAYRRFSINDDNYLHLSRDGRLSALIDLLADDGTGLKFYSTPNPAAQHDLSLSINHLNIGELTEALPYMPNLKGLLHGDAHYMQADSTSNLSVDLGIDKLVYNNTLIGNMGLVADYLPNTDGSHYVDAYVTHTGREVATLTGRYDNLSGQMLGDLDISHLPLTIANAFLPEDLIELNGYVDGTLALADGDVDGTLRTDSMHILERDFNIDLRVLDDTLRVDGSVLRIPNLRAYSAHAVDPMTLGGYADLSQGRIDLRLQAKNYPLINAQRRRGSSGYGKMFVDIDAAARGPLERMRIDGDLRVLGNTDFNYILDDSPITVEDELSDLVTFCDFTDTTTTYPAVTFSRDDMVMQMRVAVEQAAHLHCLLSSDGSDRIDLQGGGDLTLNYDSQHGMSLYGRYTVLEGVMRYSIMNIPLNNFKIKNGSYVEFTGNIDNPHLNLQADSRIKASVMDGDKPRNVPFNVGLALSQTLDDMGLQFIIESPEDLTTQNELATMSPDERSRVAVTMLVTGMYLPSSFDVASGYNYSNTLNTFLQSAVNRVAGQAASTVDLNFGIENSTTATGATTTDYSFSFAKRFWGNRISLVIGGKVSSGKEAVNNGMTLINNVSIEYRLDKTATRYVRLYYDRNHESLIEGELTEMGAGLVFHRKTDRLSDLFIFKKEDLAPVRTRKNNKTR